MRDACTVCRSGSQYQRSRRDPSPRDRRDEGPRYSKDRRLEEEGRGRDKEDPIRAGRYPSPGDRRYERGHEPVPSAEYEARSEFSPHLCC